MSTSDICKDSASKLNSISELNDMLNNMSTDDVVAAVSVCANCGKEGAKNTCNKCKQVNYCNAACKKKHRHKHKAECEEHLRLSSELAAEMHDEELFKQPPPLEDCPICFIRIPILNPTGSIYMSCCGKTLCSGCIHAPIYDNQGNEVDNKKCPFCRTPHPPSEEDAVERLNKRVEVNDANAIHDIGYYYKDGIFGYPQDYNKSLEFYHRAAELGLSKGYLGIGNAYYNGRGVEVDNDKAVHYYEQAAMEGNIVARHNLGGLEANTGNMFRALKHYMIAVRGGDSDSLKNIKQLFSYGYASKEDYTKALQLYQEYLGEIKSSQRDKAAAFSDRYCYY